MGLNSSDRAQDIQVLVYIHSIPEELLERLPGGPRAGDRVPDVDIGDQVELMGRNQRIKHQQSSNNHKKKHTKNI